MSAARIVVIGSSNTDMVVKAARIPQPGETVLGGEFVMVPGGKGANQAVAAARLGAEVTLVTRLGSDLFAEASLRSFREAGVRTEAVVQDPEAASGVALILVDEGGENAIAVAPGANARLAPEDVDRAEDAICAADAVVLQLEVPLPTVVYAIRLAKRHGRRVILNPAPAAPVPNEALEMVDFLTPNETEAEMTLGGGAARVPSGWGGIAATAEALRAKGVGAVIVTLGREGAYVAGPEGSFHVPGRHVDAVDTTAAGDVFTAALACASGEGQPLRAALEFAIAAAALSVTRIGAQSSLPHRSEVEAFL